MYLTAIPTYTKAVAPISPPAIPFVSIVDGSPTKLIILRMRNGWANRNAARHSRGSTASAQVDLKA